MSWSWSHTEEAYQYAEKQLRQMTQKNMVVIWAEWRTHQKAQADALEEAEKEAEENDWPEPHHVNESHDFDQDYYQEQLIEAKIIIKRVGKEPIADDIWNWASELRTCTNGGWEAWMCPYGCQCHMVPFGPKEKK